MAAFIGTLLRRPARTPRHAPPSSLEQEELRGISRTVAEIHWLLLIFVLLYLVFSGTTGDLEAGAALSSGLFFYAALVMSFRYTNFYRRETRLKIAIETWGMIAFVTWVLWFTGRMTSPLLNAYFLPVMASALTLGKLTTMVNVALIASCHVLLAGHLDAGWVVSLRSVAALAAQLAPLLLLAYLTSLFSTDIRYGLQRAKLLSETDELTGLFNTRGFAIAANRLLGQALRYDRPASVLLIDPDNLTAVNEAYGRDAGDRLLRQLAKTIRTQLRAADVPARYGGDEFIALLPDTLPKGALEVAERVHSAVSATPLPLEGKSINASVSIGIACFPEDGRSLDALAGRADRALYHAKQRGRHCVARYAPGM